MDYRTGITRSYVFLILLSLTFGCTSTEQNIGNNPNTEKMIEFPPVSDGNFILYVSDQSFNISPVDISIFIDGKLAISEDFDVAGSRVPQHNWKQFQFNLEQGNHTIKAVSERGDAILEESFEVKQKNWAVIDYWYYPTVEGGAGPTPKHFTFHIGDSTIGFE